MENLNDTVEHVAVSVSQEKNLCKYENESNSLLLLHLLRL